MTVLKNGMVLFAVYGTLKKGLHNDHYMRNAEYLGEIKTKAEFTMRSYGGFPVVSHTGDTAITVEIYRLPAQSQDVNHINGLEGYTGKRGAVLNWYDTIDVETPFGTANMFIQKETKISHLEKIDNGIWK
jgi:gamma-glutamylcyclotransferase (GGCT)/AIG2-like uncharacterized protein YtfP